MSIQSHKQIVSELITAMARCDVKEVKRLMADDLTWTVCGSGSFEGVQDRAGYLATLAGVSAVLDGALTITPIGWTIENDRVAVEASSNAKLKNGATYSNRYHFLFTVRDGKIASVREYMDTLHVERLFGALQTAAET